MARRLESRLDTARERLGMELPPEAIPEKTAAEMEAECRLRSALGNLRHYQDLRKYGLFWGGNAESHRVAVNEGLETLEAAKQTIAEARVCKRLTNEQLHRIADGGGPEAVVANWAEMVSKEADALANQFVR